MPVAKHTLSIPVMRTRAITAVTAVLALGILVGLNEVGQWMAHVIPVPGNVIGLLLLLGLLGTRALRLEWLEPTAGLFNRHLAFFFIPVAVGLLGYGTLIRSDGWALLAGLVVAIAAGIVVVGGLSQHLARHLARGRKP